MQILTKIGRTAGLLLVLSTLVSPAWSQDDSRSFAGLESRLRVGDTVRIVDHRGAETQGRVDQITPTSLNLTVAGSQRTFPQAEIREVRRRGHFSTVAGITIGALGGGITGLVICETSDVEGRCPGRAATSAFYAGLGVGMGVVTSLIIPDWQPVFTRTDSVTVHVTPTLSFGQQGLGIAVRF